MIYYVLNLFLAVQTCSRLDFRGDGPFISLTRYALPYKTDKYFHLENVKYHMS